MEESVVFFLNCIKCVGGDGGKWRRLLARMLLRRKRVSVETPEGGGSSKVKGLGWNRLWASESREQAGARAEPASGITGGELREELGASSHGARRRRTLELVPVSWEARGGCCAEGT